MPDGRRGGDKGEQGSEYLNQDYGDGDQGVIWSGYAKMGKWIRMGWDGTQETGGGGFWQVSRQVPGIIKSRPGLLEKGERTEKWERWF